MFFHFAIYFYCFSINSYRFKEILRNKKSTDLSVLSSGSNGARTRDLSRVRRTLIPAELCFLLINAGTLKSLHSMDLAGIEPASESLSLAASPITVAVLTFPPQHAHRQAYCFSSFMIHLPGQSLPGKVSHKVDARLLKCECNRTDGQHLGCHY